MAYIEKLHQKRALYSLYSDLHKDAYGIRPSHDVSTWGVEDFRAAIDACDRWIEQQMEDHYEEQDWELQWSESETRWREFTADGALLDREI